MGGAITEGRPKLSAAVGFATEEGAGLAPGITFSCGARSGFLPGRVIRSVENAGGRGAEGSRLAWGMTGEAAGDLVEVS